MKDLIFDIQRFENVSNDANDTVITGTDDSDRISNEGSNVTINGTSGYDRIENYGGKVADKRRCR